MMDGLKKRVETGQGYISNISTFLKMTTTEKTSMNNYRPISLLPSVSKLLEKNCSLQTLQISQKAKYFI